ncbi:MAG: thiamine diphosphokinase [Peptostreptococcaceae bacterium]|nr:thiamine diphosphokinase [Peptostreptococcaceae bacterium]
MQQKDKKTALVVSNGDNDILFLQKIHSSYDLIVAADGAADKLSKAGIRPDVIVGDLDSIDDKVLKDHTQSEVELVALQRDKDHSDTHVALELVKDRGFFRIDLVGAFGSRWDHSIGNLNLLYWAYRNGLDLQLISPNNSIGYYKKGHYFFPKKENTYWSCLALFEDALIDISNMKYTGQDLLVRQGESIGLSNEYLKEDGELNIKKGSVLVIQSQMDRSE